MLRIGWESPEVPEYDPDKHNPEKVFAFLCYRGIHYAKTVYIDFTPDSEPEFKPSPNLDHGPKNQFFYGIPWATL